ncbi:MAG: hypothetical protein K8F56_06405, partial [Rhodocyclaceae bacterium]|nr:hypothetical protein [Rhodocyclaceae bacterium]
MAVTITAHAPILPILIPFAAALVLMAGTGRGLAFQRGVGLAAALAGIAAAAWLTLLADRGEILVYALGDWPAPFGIVLAADRLAAGMTLLTALLAAVCLLHASHGFDARGRHFHALFQLQIVGLQGAFLTGDLFNLFVFFEVMLLASYALLAHGGGLARTRAGLAYVVLNLAGSALFLIALGMLYGTLGTLNLADVALRLKGLGHDFAPVRLAAALLVAVFALKAALLPLSFWLPMSYAAAGAPVAALFAIMTKVGIVALLRVQVVAFAPAARARRLAGARLRRRPAGRARAGRRRPHRGGAVLPRPVHPRRRRLLPAGGAHRGTARRRVRRLPAGTGAGGAVAGAGLPGRRRDCRRAAALLRLHRQADAARSVPRDTRRNDGMDRAAAGRLPRHGLAGAQRQPPVLGSQDGPAGAESSPSAGRQAGAVPHRLQPARRRADLAAGRMADRLPRGPLPHR